MFCDCGIACYLGYLSPRIVIVIRNYRTVCIGYSGYVILRVLDIIVLVLPISKTEVIPCFVIEEQHDLVPGLLPRKDVAVVEILGGRHFARLGKAAFKTQNHPLS